jgi:predicted TIM-barrel fold metal-dependent hydrolase
MIDTNVYLSRWPARRLPCDETPALVAKLKANGVTQAWAGSFDALLHRDIGGVNGRLAAECREHGDGLLVPFGTVNPTLPDWEEDLRRCHEQHKMSGIRLHPNYHGYTLAGPSVAALLEQAAARGMLVQIALRMEDPRTQHKLLAVEDVDAMPLVERFSKLPKLRLELLNALSILRPDALDKLIAAGEVFVEIASLEGIGGLANLLKHVPPDRILFGSHAPFFAWESAQLKLQESALAGAQRAAIERGNAAKILQRP